MTYPVRISLHRPHRWQNDSRSFACARAPEIYGPIPFSGMSARNSRTMPPTPNSKQPLCPRSFLCNTAHAISAGLNPSPDSTLRSQVSPLAEMVRANSFRDKHLMAFCRPALARDHKVVSTLSFHLGAR